MKIKFRPHHFLCSLGFEGKGYSIPFVKNYFKVLGELRKKDILIEVVEETDTICGPCPHRQGRLCKTQEKIKALDQAHASLLKIKAGDKLSWSEARSRIAQRISLKDFDQICAPCEWQKLGICKRALKRSQKEFKYEEV